MLTSTALYIASCLIPPILADSTLDATRTGTYYTEFPIYRSGSGTNTVKVFVGNPGVEAQLTLSTNVNFIQVASTRCSGCTNNNLFDPTRSSTWTPGTEDQVNILIYPQAPQDTLTFSSRLGTDILLDSRGQDQVACPVSAVDRIESGRDGQGGGAGQDISLGRVSGFYGLGINQQDRQLSIIATMLNAEHYSPNQPVPKSFFVAFDIDPYVNQVGIRAGSMHWGAAPRGKWVGDFNWLECDRTIGGSWAVSIDNIRMGGNVIDTTLLYATFDPGFDGIYVPSKIAEQLFANIQGARRDLLDPRRWTIPCNFIQSMSISIQSATYNFNPTQLVQPKEGQTCYSQVQAWTNGSVAEAQGEIRFGTSFLTEVYAAIYYSPNQQFVALAGKPGSVNDFNLAGGGSGMPNMKLAGILIGTLLGALLILFVICYARNRSSFQSVWSRGARRMQRAQMNAIVRHTTIPPPMMSGPFLAGPVGYPAMVSMGPGSMRPGLMGPGWTGPGPMGPMPAMSHPGFQQYQQQPPFPHPIPQTLPQQPSLLPAHHRGAEVRAPSGQHHPSSLNSNTSDPPPAAFHPATLHATDMTTGHRKGDRNSAPPRRPGAKEARPSPGGDDQRWPAERSDRRSGSLEPQKQQRLGHKDSRIHPQRDTNELHSTTLRASYQSQAGPLYNPSVGHRDSRPEYHHAPPESATSESLWHFGKARSVARGYESVPRHALGVDHREVRPGKGNRPGMEGANPRWKLRTRGSAERDISDAGERGDWREVERNREQEGLTGAGAWNKA